MKDSPFFKISLVIITTYFFFSGLVYIKELIVPIIFAGFLSMLILPLCKKLERKMNNGLAIGICVLLIITVISLLFFLIYTQLASLSKDYPLMKAKAIEKLLDLQIFIAKLTNIPISEQVDWVEGYYTEIFTFGGDILKDFLIGFTNILTMFILVIIYIIFFLSLRKRIKNFILKLFKNSQERVKEIIFKIQGLTRHYVVGLLLQVLALGILNSIGFLLLGLKQAIFFGFLAAILNLIPYIGALIGSIFPILIAFIYKDSIFYPIAALAVIILTQFIDNNILTPKIVASHIKINALATIIVILIGGYLWDLAGMILFLPLLGMLKIICDQIEPLKPLGYLIGEDDNDDQEPILNPTAAPE